MKKINCILFIDDNLHTNFLNQRLAKKMGLTDQIFCAVNGKEGLEYVMRMGRYHENGQNYPCPDLIFLDLNMPVMDGWEFLEEFEKNALQEKVGSKIILLTTSPNPDDKARAKEISIVNGFECKPLTEEMMEQIVYKYFPE